MINIKLTGPTKQFSLWLKIVLGIAISCIVVFILWFGGIFLFWRVWSLKNNVQQGITLENYSKEILQVPEIKVKNSGFPGSGEGTALLVRFEIANKGTSAILYGRNQIVGIEYLGSYNTLYDCFYTNPDGVRMSYARSVPLSIGKDSPFRGWFPFEVDSFRDLVDRYDQIVAILNTFPTGKRPPIVDERHGIREVVSAPNSDYVVHQEIDGKEATCDLFKSSQDSTNLLKIHSASFSKESTVL